VKSERAELRQAEGFFRRALELDPQMTEARLRLGHVLLMQEHYAEAAAELRKTVDPSGDHLLRFYASMFLGAAEEALGHTSEALEAYSSAAKLYPTAQSAKVALSAFARRQGDRDAAWLAMQQVFALPQTEPERDDPWWTYTQQQGRTADLLLENVRQPFQRGAPR
jgi:cytochrome c-type biogenesis protein CcmH/NrfG